MSKKCEKCGSIVDDNVKFCPNCGGSDFEAVAADGEATQQMNNNGGYQQPQGYQQNPNPGYQQPQGYQQNPNPGYQQPQGYQQNPNPGYQQPQGYQQNPNPGFQQNQPAPKKKKSKAGIIVLIVVGVIVFLLAIIIIAAFVVGGNSSSETDSDYNSGYNSYTTAETTAATTTEKPYSPGTLSGNVYTNKSAGFRITFPDNFEQNTDADNNYEEGNSKSTQEVSFKNDTIGTVSVTAIEGLSTAERDESYVLDELKDSILDSNDDSDDGYTYSAGSIFSKSIAGTEYQALAVTYGNGSVSIPQYLYVHRVGNTMILITITGYDSDSVTEMLGFFEPCK